MIESVLASAVRFATPLVLAATGEVVVERAGVLNVGIEGGIIVGAAAAFLVAWATGSVALAIVAALVAGALLASILAALVLGLRVDQVTCGLGLNLLAFGAAGTAYVRAVGTTGTNARVVGLDPVAVPGLRDLPLLGPAFFEHEPLAYVAALLALAVALVVARTDWGVTLRATGDHPLAAESAGVRVRRVRAVAILIGGALAGLAGADLVLGHVRTFAEDLSSGRGFMALALVLFGRWRPGSVALAALFFGGAEALEVAIKAQGLVVGGYDLARAQELVRALPYVLTLAALAVKRRDRNDAPAALGVPYP